MNSSSVDLKKGKKFKHITEQTDYDIDSQSPIEILHAKELQQINLNRGQSYD